MPSTAELFQNFDLFQAWAQKKQLQQASTVMEVKHLFETLLVELEVTAVK
ncbi:conserved hypothetical protein [Sphingobacterium multivorum]|uniref:Uncharacterized protein n=1 Tax=Sphingobacterium multivorum TaxID=28454 RepID=A0A654DJB1_SPHMU|nr:conserved hypothetical protein [Sphingobacterium multivorum]